MYAVGLDEDERAILLALWESEVIEKKEALSFRKLYEKVKDEMAKNTLFIKLKELEEMGLVIIEGKDRPYPSRRGRRLKIKLSPVFKEFPTFLFNIRLHTDKLLEKLDKILNEIKDPRLEDEAFRLWLLKTIVVFVTDLWYDNMVAKCARIAKIVFEKYDETPEVVNQMITFLFTPLLMDHLEVRMRILFEIIRKIKECPGLTQAFVDKEKATEYQRSSNEFFIQTMYEIIRRELTFPSQVKKSEEVK